MELLTIVTSIASIINALGIIFIAAQVFSTKEQTKKHHEQARRDNTINIMFTWSQSIRKETAFAERIVEKLNKEQCRALFNQQSFYVSTEIKKLLCDICPSAKSCCEQTCENTADGFLVEGLQLSELRWYVITYLNMLETVMAAWKLNIMDSKTVESEFGFLYNEEKGWNALENFRAIAGGGKTFPYTEEFCRKLQRNREPHVRGDVQVL